jgi:hypothetical protein
VKILTGPYHCPTYASESKNRSRRKWACSIFRFFRKKLSSIKMKFTASAIASIALLGLSSPVMAESKEHPKYEVKKSPIKSPKPGYEVKSPKPHKSHKKSCSTASPTPTGTETGTETPTYAPEETEEVLPGANEDENLYGNSALVLQFAAIPAVAILFAI